ncbi:ATP-binding protein [Streptomyces sp. H27-D2]|uniref:ATP-binding protein n=1 Tax=Streptomyces sp. H27-D2 TaxID=3046304 RepID=UPI002DB6B487|nr:ATP-binding protein [Streptomyces sp. H27-D2]MEC4015820.1 ATP-binding protein [Streptomyces sp. H27-D2]
MSMWWSLHLRRDAASVPLARRLLIGAMDTAGVDPDISFELALALSEACANAVEHGGGASGGDYRVTAFIEGDTCRIEVADSGPGLPAKRARRGRRGNPRPYDPARASEPVPVHQEHGRGLFLIEALADNVAYRNGPGRGAVVSFDKILKWREGASLLRAS